MDQKAWSRLEQKAGVALLEALWELRLTWDG